MPSLVNVRFRVRQLSCLQNDRRHSNPDFQINPDLSRNVVDALSCRRQSFNTPSMVQIGRWLYKINVQKIPYSATVKFWNSDPESTRTQARTCLLLRVNSDVAVMWRISPPNRSPFVEVNQYSINISVRHTSPSLGEICNIFACAKGSEYDV